MSLYPFLRYDDARAAIDFLQRAFGFEPKLVVPGRDGKIDHAQLVLGGGIVMLGSACEAAGAEIIMPLTNQEYGSREYAARDPEGYLWSFGTYRP